MSVPAASDDEIQLANRLLEQNNWNGGDSLSFDSAVSTFRQNGLSFKQVRDIWRIADTTGSGTLSRDELVVAIRLIGWAQVGEAVNEGLLSKTGPLPKLIGFTDNTPKKFDPPLPPTRPDDTSGFEYNFKDSSSVDGYPDTDELTDTYMKSRPALGHTVKIADLAEANKRGDVESHEFALGMHLVQLLKSWSISVPSSVSLKLSKALNSEMSDHRPPLGQTAQPNSSLHSSLSLSVPPPILQPERNLSPPEFVEQSGLAHEFQLPGNVESSLQTFVTDIKNAGNISGYVARNFAAEYNLSLAALVRLWDKSDIHGNYAVTPTRLKRFSLLVRRKLAETITQNAIASDTRPNESSVDPLVVLPRPPKRMVRENTDTDEFSPSRNISQDFSPKSKLPEYTITPPLHHSLTQTHSLSGALDEIVLTDLKRETTRLPQLAEKFISAQSMNQNKLHQMDDLHDENNHFKSRLSEEERKVVELTSSNDQLRQRAEELVRENARLRTELSNAGEQKGVLERTTSALKEDVSKQRFLSQEFQGELLKDAGPPLSVTLPPSVSPHRHDLRMLFLRASLGESRTATASAMGEAEGLRQIVATQSEQITALQKQILDLEHHLQSDPPLEDGPSFFDRIDGPVESHNHWSPSDDDSTDSDSSSLCSELWENGPVIEPFPLVASPTSADILREVNEDLRRQNYSLISEFRELESNTNSHMRRFKERLSQEIGCLTEYLTDGISESTSLKRWEIKQREMLRRARAETAQVQEKAKEEADHLGRVIDSQMQALLKVRARLSKRETKVKIQTSTSLNGYKTGP